MRIIFFLLTLMFSANSTFALEIYAHRGGRSLEPENTLPAYKHALAVGVNYIDMDLNMTKDGVLVITHNFFLNPDITKDKTGHWLKNKKILIKSLTLKELKQYNVCQKKFGTQYSFIFPHQHGPSFCNIPTLLEVIHYVKKKAGKQVGFQIEMKTNPLHPEWTFSPKVIANAVAKVIHENHIESMTEVQAFDYRCLEEIQKIDPNIKTAYLTQFDSKQIMLNPNKEIASLWSGGHLLENYYGSFSIMISSLGGRLWDPQDRGLTRKMVKEAHKYGLKVVVWNSPHHENEVFDSKEIIKLIHYHVDGIITDDPVKLRKMMKKMRLKVPPKIR